MTIQEHKKRGKEEGEGRREEGREKNLTKKKSNFLFHTHTQKKNGRNSSTFFSGSIHYLLLYLGIFFLFE